LKLKLKQDGSRFEVKVYKMGWTMEEVNESWIKVMTTNENWFKELNLKEKKSKGLIKQAYGSDVHTLNNMSLNW
jgi:topoisomerase IA-like protein